MLRRRLSQPSNVVKAEPNNAMCFPPLKTFSMDLNSAIGFCENERWGRGLLVCIFPSFSLTPKGYPN
jgi:hypothetical protein